MSKQLVKGGGLKTALTIQSLSHGCVMQMSPDKGEIAVHGSHYPGDMAVLILEALARPHSRPQSQSFLGHVIFIN